jgi:hypothetical protein
VSSKTGQRLLVVALAGGVLVIATTQLLRGRVGKVSVGVAPAVANDPLAQARAATGVVGKREAKVPPACYTKMGGRANPCWVCHTRPQEPNHLADWDLQEAYAFSDAATTNRWDNLFVDRRARIAAIPDAEILAYVRQDNAAALRAALRARAEAGDYAGFVPDLDLDAGFDDDGFARDGSGWRAFRYKPFLGTFFPANGSTSDVMIRLPPEFSRDATGRASDVVLRANLAPLEAAIAAPPAGPDGRAPSLRLVEPIDEAALGIDVDGDGRRAPSLTHLAVLPVHGQTARGAAVHAEGRGPGSRGAGARLRARAGREGGGASARVPWSGRPGRTQPAGLAAAGLHRGR